jgi:hypothetical protein
LIGIDKTSTIPSAELKYNQIENDTIKSQVKGEVFSFIDKFFGYNSKFYAITNNWKSVLRNQNNQSISKQLSLVTSTDKMKSKVLNFLLIFSSLFGYLEWSGNKHLFLFEAEAEIFSKLFTDPVSVLHPFTVLPIVGQILLVITLFQKTPNKTLTYISVAGLGLLLGFIFIVGLMSINFKIIISTIPFIVLAIFVIRHHKN